MTAGLARRLVTRDTLAWSLTAVALLCFTWVLATWTATWWVQSSNEHLLEDQIRAHAAGVASPARVDETTGRLEIARVGLRAMVLRGTDDTTLRVAVGHVEGTPWPGEPGNAALAGHRDTFFRPLKDVQLGDEITFTSRSGVSRYRVSETKVVGPRDVDVLDQRHGPMLTLVTCYPFSYVGPAPSRLIVHARPVAADATSTHPAH